MTYFVISRALASHVTEYAAVIGQVLPIYHVVLQVFILVPAW